MLIILYYLLTILVGLSKNLLLVMFAKVCESNIHRLACILLVLYLRTAPRDGTEQYSACTDRAPQRSQKRRRHKVSMLLLHRQTD